MICYLRSNIFLLNLKNLQLIIHLYRHFTEGELGIAKIRQLQIRIFGFQVKIQLRQIKIQLFMVRCVAVRFV